MLSDGQYAIVEVVRVGVARFYVQIRNSMIPRFALYASFYAGVTFFMVIMISEIPSHIMVFFDRDSSFWSCDFCS